jgi:hypothetical protein
MGSQNPVLRTSNAVVLFTGPQEENLKVFFGRFLIVHLAVNCDMDDYLGFRLPGLGAL